MEHGRLRIVCDLKPTGNIDEDKIIIPKILSSTLSVHDKNIKDIKRLFEYYYNETDIRSKPKTQQPEINNKISVDYASVAVSTINGYSFANSLTFSSRRTDNEDQMKAFNDSLNDDNYARKLKEVVLNYGICGLAYKYIMPANEDEIENGIYYKTFTDLRPEETFCVYDNTAEHNKICAVNYHNKRFYSEDYSTYTDKIVYTVWTKFHQWQFVSSVNKVGDTFDILPFIVNGIEYAAYPLPYKMIPIVEYRSLDGTGYYELAMDMINAINAIASARVDDVQQSVDYVIVLRDIDTESEGALEKIKKCLEDGILSFRSINGAVVQPSVDVLDTKLNQSEIQTLQDFLCDKLEEILNIPNRNNKSSGGDTGSAVESRNGFRSLENKAAIVTDDIIAGENEALKVIFAICKNETSCEFKTMKPRDVEVKDNRNKYENLTNASNAYSTLRAAGINDRTALEITKLVPDAITTAKLNEQAKQQENELAIENEVTRSQRLSEIQGNENDGSDESTDNNGSNAEK